MAGFYGEVIARSTRAVLFSIAAGRGDAPQLGLKGQHWFPLACVHVTREAETGYDFLIVPTELALLRLGEQMAKAKSTTADDPLRRDDVERYYELNEQRKNLERQAENIEREQKLIKAKIIAFIKDQGGKSLAVAKWGFRLAINLWAGTVKWKDEFIRVASAEEATQLSDAAPKQERLSVEKVERAA